MKLSDQLGRLRSQPGLPAPRHRHVVPALRQEEVEASPAAVSQARASLPGGLSLGVSRTAVVLGLVAFILGLFVAAQLQSTQVQAMLSSETKTETAANTIKRLEQEQADLKKTIGDTRARLAKAQQAQTSQQSTFAQLSQSLEQEKLRAGLVPLKGRGVRVLLDDSGTTKIPPKDDPSLYIVHEYQVRDVVNLLWLSGAEAISLNGERIVASSSVYCVGSTILVNDTRLSPPYEILAIGDPAALESALNDPASLRSLKPRVKSYGVQFSVSQVRELSIPAYNGTLAVRYSTVPNTGTIASGQLLDNPRQGQ